MRRNAKERLLGKGSWALERKPNQRGMTFSTTGTQSLWEDPNATVEQLLDNVPSPTEYVGGYAVWTVWEKLGRSIKQVEKKRIAVRIPVPLDVVIEVDCSQREEGTEARDE